MNLLSKEQIEESLAIWRNLLRRRGAAFPEHLVEPVSAALADPERSLDMTLQLQHMADIAPYDHEARRMRVVGGRLLCMGRGLAFVQWGRETFAPQEDFLINQEPCVVGDQPCWIERSRRQDKERVVRPGRPGTPYPRGAITDLTDCGGVPCYVVNYREDGEPPVGFVVLDDWEGTRYAHVYGLCAEGDRPAYAACDGTEDRLVFVWGAEEICRGRAMGEPVVADGIPHVKVTRARTESYELWRGREMILSGPEIHGPSNVRGRLAYGHWDGSRTTVEIRDERRVFNRVRNWRIPYNSRNEFVLFDTAGGVYANFTRICNGTTDGSSSLYDDRTACLRVTLKDEREVRTFNLADLGVVPPRPAAP